MSRRPRELRIVPTDSAEAPESPPIPERGDVVLLAALLVLNVVPIAGQLSHHGQWGSGTVGLATASALVLGRQLWHEVRDSVRARFARFP